LRFELTRFKGRLWFGISYGQEFYGAAPRAPVSGHFRGISAFSWISGILELLTKAAWILPGMVEGRIEGRRRVVVGGRRDRFFDKKHRRCALCLWDFLGLLGPFWTAILEVNLRVNFALFLDF
jgi:hypothetical protein